MAEAVPLPRQIDAAARELRTRRAIYPRMVRRRAKTVEAAEAGIADMWAILNTLRAVQADADLQARVMRLAVPQACHQFPDCDCMDGPCPVLAEGAACRSI
jgi:hypothetical protein